MMTETAPLVDVKQAAARFERQEAILLDVREPFELNRAQVKGALHVPMRDVAGRLDDLPQDKPILVMCHHGGRSQMVADWLLTQGYSAENVSGGINAWADVVDPSIGKY